MGIDANTNFDFNQVNLQRDLIPENSVQELQLKIHAGGAGDNGWRTRSKKGESENIACEFTVIGGDYNGKKFREWHTICGTTSGHDDAGKISMKFFRLIVDSAKGLRSDDKSEAAESVRKSFSPVGQI
jgi:hypothetical protein